MWARIAPESSSYEPDTSRRLAVTVQHRSNPTTTSSWCPQQWSGRRLFTLDTLLPAPEEDDAQFRGRALEPSPDAECSPLGPASSDAFWTATASVVLATCDLFKVQTVALATSALAVTVAAAAFGFGAASTAATASVGGAHRH